MGIDDAVSELTTATKDLADEVRITNENRAADRTILLKLQSLARTLKFVIIGKAITIALVLILMIQVLHLVNDLNDCISPEGECAKRSAAVTGALVANIGKTAEVERITTELDYARQTNNQERVVILERRYNEVQDELRKTRENVEDIRNGQEPRNK